MSTSSGWPVKSPKKKRREHRQRNVRAALVARRLLHLRGGTNKFLFQKIAEVLGRRWDGTKAAGYALVHEYVQSPGVERDNAPSEKKSTQTKAQYVISDDFLLSYEWRRLRMVVLKKLGARCGCCGATPKDGVKMHVDHVKPRRLFPDLALVEENLQILCEVCNHGKGNWDQTDWREKAPTSTETKDIACAPLWWNMKPRVAPGSISSTLTVQLPVAIQKLAPVEPLPPAKPFVRARREPRRRGLADHATKTNLVATKAVER